MPARFEMIQIAAQAERAELSKAQAQFNKWIRAIDKQRHALREWQTQIQAYRERYTTEYSPQLAAYDALRAELARGLEHAHGKKGFSARERAKLSDLITHLVRGLLANRDDPALRELFDRHSPTDFATETANELAAMKSMAEDMLNIELGDAKAFDSVEAMLAHARDLHDQRTAGQVDEAATETPKKSAKALAKEQRLAAEAKRLNQSLREIYRKLASALHPDREQDPIAREHKTALMQQVNQAYEKNDLLRLLELQLEVEQIDHAGLNAISEERLKHYNKILREQHTELKEEIDATENSFRTEFDIDPDITITPKNLVRLLQQQLADIRVAIANLRHDLRSLQDSRYLREWLKGYRVTPRMEDDAQDLRFD